MDKFIIYEHPSGEIIFVRRESIVAFHPVFISKHLYAVHVVVGKEKFRIKDCGTLQEAKEWCLDQVAQIEGPTPGTKQSTGPGITVKAA